MGERLKLWAESSLGLCTPCSKVLVNIKVRNSLLETKKGMVTILLFGMVQKCISNNQRKVKYQ